MPAATSHETDRGLDVDPAFTRHRDIIPHTATTRHPLNVKPSGNFMLQESHLPWHHTPRYRHLGLLASFPDDVIMNILSYVQSPRDLLNLAFTSRFLYAFAYDEELWRKLCIHSMGDKVTQWRGLWKCTMLGIDLDQQADLQLTDNDLCLDVLYRPFQCLQIDYDKVFWQVSNEEEKRSVWAQQRNHGGPPRTPPGGVARVSEQWMTLERYNELWHDKPFILSVDDDNRWPQWDLSTLLQRFPQVKFRQEAVQWPLALYALYLQQNRDESPLYLFDCSSEAILQLKQEYSVPKIFQHDLFHEFSQYSCRPDNAWLIVGPKRSGSTFHKDPNFTSAWNTALTGRKLWIMLPTNITPPGVGTDDAESEVTSPVGVAEWVMLGFFNDCLKIEECQIAVTFPGECMHVPSSWWHSVINLDDSVALTQNFVPEPKLGNVLHFFKNKRDQISGFRPKEVKEAIKSLLQDGELSEQSNTSLHQFVVEFSKLSESEQNEDCGEIAGLPPMPIFELFCQLLICKDKQSELESGLAQMARMEKAARGTGKSQLWEKLQEEKQSGFSFGFDNDDD